MVDINQSDVNAWQRQLALLVRTEAEFTAAGMPDAVLAPLRGQIAELKSQLGTQDVIGSATGDILWRDKVIHGDDIGGDKVARNKVLATLQDGARLIGGDAHGLFVITSDNVRLTMAPDQVPAETLLAAYYRSLAGEACRLPLGVIDVEFVRTSGDHSPPLPEVYVDLDVVAPPEKDTAGERGWALLMARGEGRDRLPLLEALARPESRCTVLLGDAGSGKSTFVNYVAYQVASGKSGLPEAWHSPLVARFILREVAARHIPAGATRGTAEMLWNALHEDMAACLGNAAAGKVLAHLQARLWQEGGLILLDGLDEVPAAGRRRKALLEAVVDLADSLPAATSRILVTARPYAYADKAWRLAGFSTLALAPFSEAQVRRFVDRWYQAVRGSMQWSVETARGKGEGLQQAIDERPYLADLASRPLLLTLMATLHSSWGTLPEDRAGLYEETVKLLLGRWQRAREVRGPDGQLQMEPGISDVLGVGEDRIRTALQGLAYTVHTRQRKDKDGQEGPADIGEGEVLVAFKALLGAVGPDTLIKYLQERAGLLIGRREGVYAFPHRSFQEYLAACHLADLPDFAEQVQRLAWEDPFWWREVALLSIGKAKQGGLGNAVGIVNVLLPEGPDDVDSAIDTHWRVATLAALALRELRLAEKAQGQRHYEAVLKRVRQWLVRLLAGGRLPVRERLEAGDTLAWLGDLRFHSAEQLCLPAEPQLGFVEVPAGPFVMGSDADMVAHWNRKAEKAGYSAHSYDDEQRHADWVDVPYRYWIGRYPITNAQFLRFVEDGGYTERWRRCWTEAGQRWLDGERWSEQLDQSWQNYYRNQGDYAEHAGYEAFRDQVLQPYLQGFEKGWPEAPYWTNRRYSSPTRPVVGVTWHEAVAYANWLHEMLREAPATPAQLRGLLSNGYHICLPSEAEWEKAARGGLRIPGPEATTIDNPLPSRIWPWGDDWDPNKCNTAEGDAPLGWLSPVGMFPDGNSPYGCSDMTGNVWEWTRSAYADYPFLVRPADGSDEAKEAPLRVVRGGSWDDVSHDARCAVRGFSVPGIMYLYLGMRVVCAPLLS